MDYQQRQHAGDALRVYCQEINLEALVRQYGTPLLVLDPSRAAAQYRTFQRALPDVKPYFALKALEHPAIIRAIAACDGYLDVATPEEIRMIQAENFPIDHCMHTHPIKKPSEIDHAYNAGLRRFVVDNQTELQKFAGRPNDIELMIRLSYPNPEAKSNLSYKFGAPYEEAKELVYAAHHQGSRVAGFCLHVGSQINAAGAYALAITRTVQLIHELEAELDITIRLLDIGGGFPVEYRDPVPSMDEIAHVIRPLIEPLQSRLEILAEPGRFIAAPTMLAVSQIVGSSHRSGMPWYYIDDGVYGSYSNVVYERVYPHLFALKELEPAATPPTLRPTTIAGPTCDSIDVVTTGYPLPKLEVGDLLVSPMMGSYTAVSASTFNGIPKTRIVVINEAG